MQWHEIFLKHTNLYVTKNGIVKAFRGVELYGKTLGVIGAGRIGLGVAKRAQSFGMKILAFDPYLTEDKAKSLDIQIATVDEIAEKSDFVTVHTINT